MKMKLNKGFSQAILYSAFVLNNPLEYISDSYPSNIKMPPLSAPYEVGAEAFKTPQEVDVFLETLRANKEFLNENKPYLVSSSNIFELPYSFQTCLLFSESRFDPHAISPVGARGVAQFTYDTHVFVAKVLRLGKAYEKSYIELRKKFREETTEKSKYIYFNRILFVELYQKWMAYLNNNGLRGAKVHKSNYVKISKQPKLSIGLSALYLKYLEEKLRYKMKDQYTYLETALNPELFLTLAGAYNQGIRRTWKLSSESLKIDLQYIIAHQSRITETKKYIKSIRSCMVSEKNNFGV